MHPSRWLVAFLHGTSGLLVGAALSGCISSAGITERDNPMDVRLLANVNPSFNWVRLAQRVPVRVHIDEIPDNTVLVAGMTCTVIVRPTLQNAETKPPPV